MSAIERGDVSDAESFGCRDHGSRSERETATSRDEFSNLHPVAGRNLVQQGGGIHTRGSIARLRAGLAACCGNFDDAVERCRRAEEFDAMQGASVP